MIVSDSGALVKAVSGTPRLVLRESKPAGVRI